MNLERLLANVRADDSESQPAIILIVDAVSELWLKLVAEAAVDDLVVRSAERCV